jgi:hypothetical protein
MPENGMETSNSAVKKKFKTQPLAGNVMLKIWGYTRASFGML